MYKYQDRLLIHQLQEACHSSNFIILWDISLLKVRIKVIKEIHKLFITFLELFQDQLLELSFLVIKVQLQTTKGHQLVSKVKVIKAQQLFIKAQQLIIKVQLLLLIKISKAHLLSKAIKVLLTFQLMVRRPLQDTQTTTAK